MPNNKRNRSPGNSADSTRNDSKNTRYDVPINSTVDPFGNLITSSQKPRATSRSSSMTSDRSNQSIKSNISQIRNYNNNIQKTYSSKPKPIFVDASLATMQSFLTPLTLKTRPLMKVMGSRKTQIICANIDDKNSIIQKLKELKFSHFTFSEQSQKPQIYVLKKYFTTTTDSLLATLKEEKIPATKVTVFSANPEFPTFLVHFEPQSTNLNSLQNSFKTVGNVVIKWERFDRARKRLTQCHNCQCYGHAASNCGMARRCIKCLDQHEPGKCARQSKEDDGTPKCVNCKGDHAANSRYCQFYINYSQMVQRQRSNRQAATFVSTRRHQPTQQAPPVIINRENFPKLPTPKLHNRNAISNWNDSEFVDSPAITKLPSLQARLAAIPDMAEVFAKFEALVYALETAQTVEQKVQILFKHCITGNGN